MRLLGALGVVLIVFGTIVLAMRGLSYTRERETVQVGPLEVAAERKGFVPPIAGAAVIVAGAVLLVVARRSAK